MPDRLEKYMSLEVSKGSPLYQDLMERVDREADESGRVTLTDYIGRSPCGLTPQMLSWYETHIDPLRSEAVQEVAAGFKDLRVGDISGCWLRADTDRIEAQRVRTAESTIRDFQQKTEEERRALQTASARYEMLRAQNRDRPPVMTSVWLYVLVLLLIGAVEAGMNFEGFAAWLPSLFFATAASITVLLIIAAVSHAHGTLLKQSQYWFGPEDKARRRDGIRIAIIAFIFLFICIALVGYARYQQFQPKLAQAALLGAPPPAIVPFMFGLVAGNILAYGFSVLVAYWWHDRDPNYPKAKEERDKLQKSFAHKRRELDAELDRLRQQADLEAGRAQGASAAIERASGFREAQDRAAKLLAQDQKVIGALSAYRSALVDRFRAAKQSPAFRWPVQRIEADQHWETLDATDYLGRKINLSLCE